MASLAPSAFAGQLFSQAELSGLLGGNMTMEDFEGNGLLGSGQISASGPLTSTSIFAGYGPGLVEAGASYNSATLYWNDNGYFGLNTRTMGDASAWRGLATEVTFTSAVDAFGFDLQGYSGFSQAGTIDVYDLGNNLISSTAVNGGFFGWHDVAGIGRVVISADTDGYIMIDNHGYGTAVPEPATMTALVLGAAVAWRRRRQR